LEAINDGSGMLTREFLSVTRLRLLQALIFSNTPIFEKNRNLGVFKITFSIKTSKIYLFPLQNVDEKLGTFFVVHSANTSRW
jgi:hypothetical protein